MKSLYSGVAGMKTHNQRMDVIGNNIANVNTTGYKASTVTFKDVYYQTKSNASTGDATSGGTNPTQVGYGSSVSTINQMMTQSGFTYSDSVYDCAIQGEGFFQVMDDAGNIYYSRSGVFTVDNYGNLTDPNGYIVLGVSGDPSNTQASSQRINLFVPSVDNNAASATKTINGYEVTISANGYGTDGNISFTIADGDTPYATLSGSNLQITMDLSQDFADMQAFETAVNDAIRAGGVNLSDDVLPLHFEVDGLPANTAATAATNFITFASEDTSFNLTFIANTAGEFANAYEIGVKTSTTATAPTAKWSNDILTITLPGGLDEDENLPSFTLEDIQNAVNRAAGMTFDETTNEWTGGNAEKMLTVTCLDNDGNETESDIDGFDFLTVTGGNTMRTGLSGGADSFFADLASNLSTVKLADGRFASDQNVSDLSEVFVDSDGTIYGVHAVHGIIPMGRIDIVTFDNPTGLNQVGTSYWTESLSSGEPNVKVAGEDGAGEIVSGALEMSNVDLSQEMSDMIITQRGFQANSRIITVSDTMLEELVNLKR